MVLVRGYYQSTDVNEVHPDHCNLSRCPAQFLRNRQEVCPRSRTKRRQRRNFLGKQGRYRLSARHGCKEGHVDGQRYCRQEFRSRCYR